MLDSCSMGRRAWAWHLGWAAAWWAGPPLQSVYMVSTHIGALHWVYTQEALTSHIGSIDSFLLEISAYFPGNSILNSPVPPEVQLLSLFLSSDFP